MSRQYREQLLSLERKAPQSNEADGRSRLLELLSANKSKYTGLSQMNERLRSENSNLINQIDELRATVEFLRAELVETEKRINFIPASSK